MYAIYCTPGTIDTRHPLAAAGIRAGKIAPGSMHDPDAKIAIYRDEHAATSAVTTLVPEGADPQTYAGLSVRPATDLVYPREGCDWVEYMD